MMLQSTQHELAVDVALNGASAEQLRRALKRKLNDLRKPVIDDLDDFHPPDPDTKIEDVDALAEAGHRWRRGDRREALHHLELALGREFCGLGDLRPEDLR